MQHSQEKTKVRTSLPPTAPLTTVPWWNMTHFWLSALTKATGVSKPYTGETSIMALNDFSLALFHSGSRRMDTVHHHSAFNGAFNSPWSPQTRLSTLAGASGTSECKTRSNLVALFNMFVLHRLQSHVPFQLNLLLALGWIVLFLFYEKCKMLKWWKSSTHGLRDLSPLFCVEKNNKNKISHVV